MQLFSCSRENARFDKPRQKLLKKRFGCGAGPLKGRSRRVGSSVAVACMGSSVACVIPSADTRTKLGTGGTCPLYAKSIVFATWSESAFEPPDEERRAFSDVENSVHSTSNAGNSFCSSWPDAILSIGCDLRKRFANEFLYEYSEFNSAPYIRFHYFKAFDFKIHFRT